MSLIDAVRDKIAQTKKTRDERQAELDAIVAAAESEQRDLNDDEAAKFAEAKQAIIAADDDLNALLEREAELADLEARKAAAAKVVPAAQAGQPIVRQAEARTYRKDNQRSVSFFADAFNAQFGHGGVGDDEARERIQRHMREVEVEHRDITTGTFNGLIPPQYLLDQAAEYVRAGRPFADAVPGYQLPASGMELVVTRVSGGTATGVQTTENSPATETNLVTTDITVPVVTIMGQQDLSRQSIERGQRTDDLVFADLMADYAAKLDTQWLTGSGTNGEAKGILTAATATQTWAGTTVQSFLSKVLGAANDVATAISAPATVVVMHPRRWHWLLAQADANGRPLAIANSGVASNPAGLGGTGYGIGAGVLVGPGLPVIVDSNVPTTLGAGTNEDRVIVTRLDRLVGWENGVVSFRFNEAAGAPQTIRLAVLGYSAFTSERYPGATSVVVGTGLAAPSF